MQLYMNTMIFSEDNCVANHKAQLAALGTRAMIVTGRHSAVKTGALADVTAALESSGIPYVIFDQTEENPSVETVMAAREKALNAGADFFIGVGGGSPMDAAKAIALMTANPQANEECLYSPEKLGSFPVACIPTTCGTGSEVTPYSILTRHQLQTKKSISHKIYPALALLDEKYLRTMGRTALINTSVDALAHLIESYLNSNTNAFNRIFSREGLRVWSTFRQRLLDDTLQPGDLKNMLHASMLAGLAIAHTGTSLPHGLSYPITYQLGIPHGRAVGMFLGGFLDTYPDKDAAREAAQLLGFKAPEAVRGYLKALLGEIAVPQELLEKSAQMLLEDPAKLKNYPFPIAGESMTAMVN